MPLLSTLRTRLSRVPRRTLMAACVGASAVTVAVGIMAYRRWRGWSGQTGSAAALARVAAFAAAAAPGDTITIGEDVDIQLVDSAEAAALHDLTKESRVFRSHKLAMYVNRGLQTPVEGLEEYHVTFGQIFDRITAMGKYHAFVYGGYIRDLLVGKVNEDIDCLFTCGVDLLQEMCSKENWTYYLKTEEKTGLKRISYIAIGRKKGKFSGHVKGRGCEGDFTMNTLLYEASTHTLIDPLGVGVDDAVNRVLRIPAKKGDGWDEWLDSDRLKGMRLLRFFNFASRGYTPADVATTQYIAAHLLRLARSEPAVFRETAVVFLGRKVLTGSLGKARVKERAFAETVVRLLHDAAVAVGPRSSLLAKSMLAGLDAGAWYAKNIVPLYVMIKSSIPGMTEAAAEIAGNYISA